MKKTLIKCPNCEKQGKTKNLALQLPDGRISVQRNYVKGRRDFTIVDGNKFTVICGECQEPAYFRKGVGGGTVQDNWNVWFRETKYTASFGTI